VALNNKSMTYGIRHSDKCSDKELKQFKLDVFDYLNELNFIYPIDSLKRLSWKTIRAFNCFGGNVKVYTGKINERMPMKLRRRLVAFKNPDGTIEGENQEAIDRLKNDGGSQLYLRHNEPIKELEYFSLFRSEWYSEDKEIADEERTQLKLFLELNEQHPPKT